MKSFIGFEYNEYFKNLIINELTPWLINKSIEPVYPINKIPGGVLADRIFSLIESCNLTLWECTTMNPNVIFELGYSIGINKPFFILFNKEYNEVTELPVLLKTQWGLWYNNSLDLKRKLDDVFSTNYSPYKDEISSTSDINSIGVITDSTHCYDSEFKIINKYYKSTKIDLIDIELYSSLFHLLDDIKSKQIIICILSKLDDEGSTAQGTNKIINSLKLLVFGIGLGLSKKSVILQKGNKTYTDVENYVKFYNNEKEFESQIIYWNKKLVESDYKKKLTNIRIKVPNLGKLIPRNHITEFIKNQLFSKHIFLRAPSGFGKTAILLNLVQSIEYNTIWYTCDDRIKDFVEIINEILAEINKFQNEVGKSVSSFNFSFYRGDLSTEDFINYFIGELQSIKEKTIIILDDVHNLKNKKTSRLLELISEISFDNVSFIFIGRQDLEIRNVDKLIKNCISLKKEDIEFKENEIQIYFEEILSINLTNEELHLLSSKSEGWIAGISLLKTIIIQKGKSAVKEIIDNLKGNKKRIYDYFADIVYDYFDESTRKHLKLISIPFKLTPKDVSFILKLPETDSINLLNGLEKQNSFLFNYEGDPFIFKFHNLFREFLLKKFEEENGISNLIQYKGELSDYYFGTKDYFESLVFGIEGENYEIAVKTIDFIGNAIINDGMGEYIFELIQKIPEKFYSDDYKFLIIKGRTEEFFTNRSNSLQTYIKARDILKAEHENKRDYNLVDFFILQSEIQQNTDKTHIPDRLLQIINESDKDNDIELYSYAFGLYSQIKRISLMIKPNINRKINQRENDEFIQEIDKAINKLENSNLNSKDIYVAQLLVDKAMISHSLSWYCALEYVTMNRLSSIFRIQISNLEKNQIEKNFSDYFAQEKECFNKALKLADNTNNLMLKANILVNRSETYDSRNSLFAFVYNFVNEDLVNQSLNDLNEALKIYKSYKNMHGIASVYNNMAQTYILKDDKNARDNYANLAFTLANDLGYTEIIKSSKEILESQTISETIRKNNEKINREMENGLIEDNENKVIENWIEMLGDISDEEKEKRKKIFKLQIKNVKIQKTLIYNWCKYIDVFHTNLPLSKHTHTDISMVKSYMNYDLEAQRAYSLSKQIIVDFSESLAVFIYCKKIGSHSDKLYNQVELSSNEFIAKFCNDCKFREL